MNGYLTSPGPPLANHLWQSTAFVLLAWLLTLALRRNQARVRYAIWLAASLKFLIPFSLLVQIGDYLPHAKQPLTTAVYSAMDVVEEPFNFTQPEVAAPIHVPTLRERIQAVLPVCLGSLWLLGVGVVFFGWWNRWRIVSRAIHRATLATGGTELAVLRRLDRGAIPLFLSQERMEPGVIGVFRPVLVWPEQLSTHLDDPHIEAIIAHELSHVRRRDNLTALIHMFVEAAFWFHPLVWWMERQMVKEREQASDEAVVELGGSAETYAESLLKTCQFCAESPLACVSGITGGDLGKRIRSIMTSRLERLTLCKKVALAAVGLVVVGVPIVLGQVKTGRRLILTSVKVAPLISLAEAPASGPKPSFDEASIRPSGPASQRFVWDVQPGGHFVASNVTLRNLIRIAYSVDGPFNLPRILGGPDWTDSDTFDLSAKPDTPPKTGLEGSFMIQSLLADRFGLVMRRETRELPIYALVIAKSGPKFHEAKDTDPNIIDLSDRPPLPAGSTRPHVSRLYRGRYIAQGGRISWLSDRLSDILGINVVDETGLTGDYDMQLEWVPDENQIAGFRVDQVPEGGGAPPADWKGPALLTALQEQLGLRLEPQKAPLEVLVIEHAEKPTPN